MGGTRPADQRDLECWFDAEAELHRQVWALAVPDGGPVVNNLDRALAPAERQRARLDVALAKELVHQSPADLRMHFSLQPTNG